MPVRRQPTERREFINCRKDTHYSNYVLYICSGKLLKDMKNKSILPLLCLLAVLSACEQEPHFTITGQITGADDKTLYLEEAGISAITPIDSVELGKQGTFTLKGRRPQYPEFYRLRVEGNIINLAVDSTETIRVEADLKDMPTGYTIEGETNRKIKELAVKQIKLQADIDRLYSGRTLAPYQIQDSIEAMVTRYKNDVKANYIFSAPNTLYAYFALFQKLNNYLIFDPLNSKDDIRCFAAVATSLNQHYPHADRSKNLYNIVIKGMKNTRAQQPQQVAEAPQVNVQETGVIDINLRDLEGNVHRLTDLKGKVIIVDFTIYQSAVSASHNYMLRDLYDKYASQGLEIYQVSLDADEHYWKTTADNLPWVCVRDGNGIYSSFASAYNVQNLPTLFLVNRANELVSRSETIKDLEKEVKALL